MIVKINNPYFDKTYKVVENKGDMFCNVAIKALEQEPFINKPCVSSGVCEHDKNKILDKIRAEIEAEIKGCKTAIDMYKENPDIVLCYKTFIQGYTKTLQIIDKYKAESEE